MGLLGYYRIFIEGFLKIYNPITELQKKNQKTEWTKKCEESFNEIKKLFTSSPILRVINMDQDFMVCIDAWKQGLHMILM